MANKPIGVFDSGLGGLTVADAIRKRHPDKKIIYFGDTARIPYGTKSKEVITKYALQDCRFLLSKGVGAIIAACGTVSANAVDVLKRTFDVPIEGVVEGAARKAAAYASGGNGTVGVLGTGLTVKSGAYEREIKKIDGSIRVISVACPMFVPLVENGYADSDAARLIAHDYLDGLAKEKPDCVILGCTHYPILKKVIGEVFESSELISAGSCAVEGFDTLFSRSECGESEFYVSDDPASFTSNAVTFLGGEITGRVMVADIEKY